MQTHCLQMLHTSYSKPFDKLKDLIPLNKFKMHELSMSTVKHMKIERRR